MCPSDSSRRSTPRRGEERRTLLPPSQLFFLVAVALPLLLTGAPAWSQPASSEGPAPEAQPSPAPAPSAEPPFVPPAPPRPSQSNIPGAFTLTTPLTSPTAVFEFHPTFGFTEEYTDNFRLSSRGRTDNFRSTTSSGFSLLINAPKTQGSISSSIGASYDSARGEGSVRLFPTLSASVRHTFDPQLSLTLTDSLTRSDEPLAVDESGLRRERRTFTSNTFGLSADYRIGLIATQSYYRNALFLSDRDTVSHVLGANASTRLGALNNIRVGYEISRSETSGGTSSGGGSSESTGHLLLASLSRQIGEFGSAGVSTSYSTQSRNDSRVWNISLFTAYGLPTGLSLSGRIGLSRHSSEDRSDTSAISTSTTASYRFAHAVVSLGLSQDFRQTFVEGEDFGVVLTRSYTGTFSYPLTPFIGTNLRAAYSENDFTGAGNTQRNRAANTFRLSAGLGWQLLRWLRMSLDYSHTERTGEGSESTSENRASLNLGASF